VLTLYNSEIYNIYSPKIFYIKHTNIQIQQTSDGKLEKLIANPKNGKKYKHKVTNGYIFVIS